MANEVYKDDANLEGLWLMEEVSGDRSDYTPNGNDLTDVNTVGSSVDCQEGGRSADFEAGVPEYLTIADGDQVGLDITGDLTICFWMKAESFGAANTMVSKYDTAGNNRSYWVWTQDVAGSDYVTCNLSSDGAAFVNAIGGTALSTGAWYHVAVVYNGTDIRIYVDGSLDSNGADNPKTYSGGIADRAAAFQIGYRVSAYPYDGLLDEVAVFSRALSADEVASVYDNGIQDPTSGVVVFRRRVEGY